MVTSQESKVKFNNSLYNFHINSHLSIVSGSVLMDDIMEAFQFY